MDLPTDEKIVKDIEFFLETRNIKPSIFGRKYFSDSGFVSRLKKGVDLRISTVRKVYKVLGEG